MLEPVAALLTQRDLLRTGCTLVLALSGGRDSVALLDVLIRLRERAGFTLLAAHMNHGLRPNARRDEEFVAALCARHGVPLWIRAVTLGHRAKSGEGLEAAARRARYAFLAEVCLLYTSSMWRSRIWNPTIPTPRCRNDADQNPDS